MPWILGWKSPSGFSSSSTAEEVTEGIDGTGLTAIVTGATSGIGLETARVLALRGVHVVMAARNVNAGKEVKDAFLKEIPSARIDVMELDLGSMASVRKFASEFISWGIPLNLLVNNAGILTMKPMVSKDNIELHFATNYLGHFLLTNLLLDTMKNTAAESNKEGRIINVSSVAHKFMLSQLQETGFNEATFGQFHRALCYGRSKLGNILHSNELARRLKEEGACITANSLHPGAIQTNIVRDKGFSEVFGKEGLLRGILRGVVKYFVKTLQQGAATTCYVALHPQVKGLSGKYFVDCNIAEPSNLAKDVELAKDLWDFSLRLTDPK